MATEAKIDLSAISKLNGENYMEWRFLVRLLLENANLWDLVTGNEVKPNPPSDEWLARDLKARTILCSTLDKSQLSHIFSCSQSASLIWEKLKSVYEDDSTFTKLTHFHRFHAYQGENKSPLEIYNEINSIVTTIRDMGGSVDDTSVISKIIGSLPEAYRSFSSAWDSCSPTDQTMSNLMNRIKKEMASRGHVTGETMSGKSVAFFAKSSVRDKSRDTCHKCGAIGHWAPECTSRKITINLQ